VAAVQIIRGTAPLPPDIEGRFLRAYGRQMNEQERRFFGLEDCESTQQPLATYEDIADAA